MNNLKVSEVQVTYKNKVQAFERVSVRSSQKSASTLRAIWDNDLEYVESVYCLFLNRANQVIGFKLIGKGGQSGAIVERR